MTKRQQMFGQNHCFQAFLDGNSQWVPGHGMAGAEVADEGRLNPLAGIITGLAELKTGKAKAD